MEDVDVFFSEEVDFQSLSAKLDNDISDVIEYVRRYIGTESMSKSMSKFTSKSMFKSKSKSLFLIDGLTGEKQGSIF